MRIGYKRVSTVDQNTARQLEGVAPPVDKVFEDHCSGKDTNRPGLAAALEFVREGDTLVVHSMDRLARNLVDLRRLVDGVIAKGARVQFVKENVEFTGKDSPMSMLLLNLLGAVAEFERAMIRERQREGIAIAKAEGRYRGGQEKLTTEEVRAAVGKIAAGVSKARVARELGVSRETLYRYLRQVAEWKREGQVYLADGAGVAEA